MKNVKITSSGYVTDQAGIWYSQSVFNSESPKMYDSVYGGQIPESFAKSKGIWFARGSKYLYHMEKFN